MSEGQVLWSQATMHTVPHLACVNRVGTYDHMASCWCMGISNPTMVPARYRWVKWKDFSPDVQEDVWRWINRY